VLFSFFPLRNYLRKEKPDFAVTTLSRLNLIVLMVKATLKIQTRIIIREANTFSILTKINNNNIEWLTYFFAKIFYKRADCIVAVSKGVAKDLIDNLNIPENNIKVIYNPIVDKKIGELAGLEPDLDWFKNKEYPLLIAAGRIAPQKDFETLLRSFEIVFKSVKSRLVIFGAYIEEEGGSAAEYDKLKKMIARSGLEEYIFFNGFESNLYRYLSRADLFILSSKSEGLPGVLIQALACGCPVISTDCPSGPREILEGGKYGSLIKIGDFETMAEEIIKNLNSPVSKDILIERAQFFNSEKSLANYLEIFDKTGSQE
jgi:glycosyltransferase involved in cell wall biosynthesis